MLASGPTTAQASIDLTESPPAKSVSNRPNVVLIVLDTTRRDHLGCYGHSGGLTPALDAIAAEGVVYEQAISQSPWTVPSHATMFTGLYPASHGCSNEHHLWLDDEFETLAELLSRAGYQTLALNSNVYLFQCNLLQGFDKSVLLRGPYEELSIHQVALAMGRPERWVDKGASEGLAELEDWFENERDTKSPFFLFLNLYETHVKYLPPYAERVEHLPQGVNFLEAARVGFDYRPTRMHIQGAIDPPQQQTLRALYAAEVRYQDRRLGEVLDYLRQNVDFDNTLVMITADHGENLGESGRWEHLYSINDLLIHVPLVIRYPSHFPAGTRIEGLCELVDLLPTVLREVELSQDAGELPGKSIRPNGFAAKKAAIAQVWPYYLYLNKVEPLRGFQRGLSDFITHRKVLRLESMKFIWSSDGRHQLYDVTADPYEAVNLVKTMPELAQQLQTRLEARWASLSAYQPRHYDSNTVAPIDDRALMQLRSLGYVGD